MTIKKWTPVVLLSLILIGISVTAGEKKSLYDQVTGGKKSLHDQFTGQGYGAAGCGLGSVIFGDKKGGIQILASTTNDTYSNQIFGISSGTSNCSQEKHAKAANLKVYVEANKLALSKDVARGSGETLAGLSQVLGCSDSSKLGQVLQKNYTEIFPSQNVDAQGVSQSILETIHADPFFVNSCHGHS